MIAFIDTEVSIRTHKVEDYGAVRGDGAQLHTRSAEEFYAFVSDCEVICGHNIINHDLNYLNLQKEYTIIDTLPLSALLFPAKPYHHLLKDDKLQVNELNNPLNDAQKARDLFNDEVAAWKQLHEQKQIIYRSLLQDTQPFSGFFCYIGKDNPSETQDIAALIKNTFRGRICENANITAVTKYYPIELAYALAVIGADDLYSITPAWVLHNYPKINNVMMFLSSRPDEYSYERSDMRNGIFVSCLIRALKGGADKNGDRIITARELFDSVSMNVKELSKDKQHPVMWGNFGDSMPVMIW